MRLYLLFYQSQLKYNVGFMYFRILNVAEGSLSKKPDMKHADAGGNMLHKVLNQWNELHTQSEENAQKAQVADEKINSICKHTNLQLSQMVQLCFSLNQLPKLVDRTRAVIQQTGWLIFLF